jgi:hypothetical protein
VAVVMALEVHQVQILLVELIIQAVAAAADITQQAQQAALALSS